MTIEIKTATLEPIRNTFSHIERRFGDKPATRYQEATYDAQAVANFHYRPLWQPEFELNDPRRTAIEMEDWYDLKDPRQFYYGAYVQQRARMQEAAENNYAFFDKRNLASHLNDTAKDAVIRFLIPVRHIEHTANLNNLYGTANGYGTAITQALLYNGMDRLGNAQYLSRIGLLLDGNSGDALTQAKAYWMEDAIWQPMRALCEESLTTEDWFELFVAQDIVIDTLTFSLFFEQFDQWLSNNSGADIAMLTEFTREWNREISRWSDSVMKTVAASSDQNRALLQEWAEKWQEKARSALEPVVAAMPGEHSLDIAQAALDKRLAKTGLAK